MTSVTLSIPTKSILDLFPQLPPGGAITRIYIDGDHVKLEYDQRTIQHPRDYPLDYDEWLRLPVTPPAPPPKPHVEPVKPAPERPRRKR